VCLFWLVIYPSRSQSDSGVSVEIRVTDPSAGWKAEVLAADSDESLLSFNVPTPGPVTVPAGEHRLRLLRPGFLSATYRFPVRGSMNQVTRFKVVSQKLVAEALPPPKNVKRGRAFPQRRWEPGLATGPDDGTPFAFRGQHLWAKPAEQVQAVYLLPGSPDLLVFGRFWFERLDGKTGAPRWRKNSSALIPLSRGELLVGDNGMPPSLDLNGHGTPDLVFGASGFQAVIALSGKTGGLLWRHAPPEVERALRAGAALAPGPRFIHRLLTLPDVDGDGVPDLAVVLVDVRGPDQPNPSSVRALSGRTGKELWTVRLPDTDKWAPSLLSVKGRDVIAVTVGGRLFGLDARTGRHAWPARALGLGLVRRPQFADLRGDGSTHVLLLGRDAAGKLVLSARALPDLTPLWDRPWPAALDTHPAVLDTDPPDFPLLADLDGNGRKVVIIPQVLEDKAELSYTTTSVKGPRGSVTSTTSALKRFEARLGVAALDGATGRTRWEHWLGRSREYNDINPGRLRFAVGPDLDGDGRPDVFVASVQADPDRPGGQTFVYVDALAGSDGRCLWWSRPLSSEPPSGWEASVTRADASPVHKLAPLLWWPVRRSGPPLLVVAVEEPQARRACCILSAATGRLLHILPEGRRPQAKDLDGDGRAELVVITGGDLFQDTATLNPIRGDAPAEVRHATRLKWQSRGAMWQGTEPANQELEEEPVAGAGAAEDPRLVVPLPWDRYILFKGINPAYAGPSPVAGVTHLQFIGLFTLTVVLVITPLAWLGARWRRRTLTAEQIRNRQRRTTRHFVAAVCAAGVLTALAGGAWLWYDADDLYPGEHYLWDFWYLTFLLAAANLTWMLSLAALPLVGAGRLGVWLYRRLLRLPARA
jgi:outer membrane protein assembly factor BamB